MKMPKIMKAPKYKKLRSKVYKPSWKQIGKRKGSGIKFPKIKITSD